MPTPSRVTVRVDLNERNSANLCRFRTEEPGDLAVGDAVIAVDFDDDSLRFDAIIRALDPLTRVGTVELVRVAREREPSAVLAWSAWFQSSNASENVRSAPAEPVQCNLHLGQHLGSSESNDEHNESAAVLV